MSTCNYYMTEKWAPLVVYESDDAGREEIHGEFATEWAEEKNAGLDWYKIQVRGGYYCGLQFDIAQKEDGAEDLDDETAREWYGKGREEIQEEMQKERGKIKHLLRSWIRDDWRELALAGVFSNGEGVYRQVAPRLIRIEGPDDEGKKIHIAMFKTVPF